MDEEEFRVLLHRQLRDDGVTGRARTHLRMQVIQRLKDSPLAPLPHEGVAETSGNEGREKPALDEEALHRLVLDHTLAFGFEYTHSIFASELVDRQLLRRFDAASVSLADLRQLCHVDYLSNNAKLMFENIMARAQRQEPQAKRNPSSDHQHTETQTKPSEDSVPSGHLMMISRPGGGRGSSALLELIRSLSSPLHNGTREAGVQATIGPSTLGRRIEQLNHAYTKEYGSLEAAHVSATEQRLLEAEKKAHDRAQALVDAKVNSFKEGELVHARNEIKRTLQADYTSRMRSLEAEYDKRMASLARRELDLEQAHNRRIKDLEEAMFDERQRLQQKMHDVRAREQALLMSESHHQSTSKIHNMVIGGAEESMKRRLEEIEQREKALQEQTARAQRAEREYKLLKQELDVIQAPKADVERIFSSHPELATWVPPPPPMMAVLEGRYCRLERLSAARHADDLWEAFDGHDSVWDYLGYGPFASKTAYIEWVRSWDAQKDPYFFAVVNKASGRAEGVMSFLRIAPKFGSIEVGHVNLSPRLQRTRVATDAMFAMMKWVFDSGYRRFEWKCDARNYASRRAAQRLGFSYEGIFRQAAVVKGSNRDTAWFAMIDQEWPALKTAFELWLSPSNFDPDGKQKQALTSLTKSSLTAFDASLASLQNHLPTRQQLESTLKAKFDAKEASLKKELEALQSALDKERTIAEELRQRNVDLEQELTNRDAHAVALALEPSYRANVPSQDLAGEKIGDQGHDMWAVSGRNLPPSLSSPSSSPSTLRAVYASELQRLCDMKAPPLTDEREQRNTAPPTKLLKRDGVLQINLNRRMGPYQRAQRMQLPSLSSSGRVDAVTVSAHHHLHRFRDARDARDARDLGSAAPSRRMHRIREPVDEVATSEPEAMPDVRGVARDYGSKETLEQPTARQATTIPNRIAVPQLKGGMRREEAFMGAPRRRRASDEAVDEVERGSYPANYQGHFDQRHISKQVLEEGSVLHSPRQEQEQEQERASPEPALLNMQGTDDASGRQGQFGESGSLTTVDRDLASQDHVVGEGLLSLARMASLERDNHGKYNEGDETEVGRNGVSEATRQKNKDLLSSLYQEMGLPIQGTNAGERKKDGGPEQPSEQESRSSSPDRRGSTINSIHSERKSASPSPVPSMPSPAVTAPTHAVKPNSAQSTTDAAAEKLPMNIDGLLSPTEQTPNSSINESSVLGTASEDLEQEHQSIAEDISHHSNEDDGDGDGDSTSHGGNDVAHSPNPSSHTGDDKPDALDDLVDDTLRLYMERVNAARARDAASNERSSSVHAPGVNEDGSARNAGRSSTTFNAGVVEENDSVEDDIYEDDFEISGGDGSFDDDDRSREQVVKGAMSPANRSQSLGTPEESFISSIAEEIASEDGGLEDPSSGHSVW